MKKSLGGFLALVCAAAVVTICSLPAGAQTNEVKEKPPMYCYVANWVVPRAQWAEFEKSGASTDQVMQKALSSGTIAGYGSDINLVHQADGSTHDDWWCSMSMAGLMHVLDDLAKGGESTTSALNGVTKHWDGVWVSRYYNWRSGTVRDGYTRVSAYKLKKDAPDDAVDLISKSIVAPIMEKLLADGTVSEYEIDTQAVHTQAPGMFYIIYLTPTAEGLDKVESAIRAYVKNQPLIGPTFDDMTMGSGHRDELSKTTATYK